MAGQLSGWVTTEGRVLWQEEAKLAAIQAEAMKAPSLQRSLLAAEGFAKACAQPSVTLAATFGGELHAVCTKGSAPTNTAWQLQPCQGLGVAAPAWCSRFAAMHMQK